MSAASGATGDTKKNISDKADQTRTSLNEFKRKAADKLEGSRQSTAKALEWTATNLHSRANQISDFTHSAADRLQDTAKYFRESELEDIAQDVQGVVKRYPGRSLAAAAILGFLIARGLRRMGA
jgi:ElaB/YqjD/DUF883 family membrane-anchored ribosome-binding protein